MSSNQKTPQNPQDQDTTGVIPKTENIYYDPSQFYNQAMLNQVHCEINQDQHQHYQSFIPPQTHIDYNQTPVYDQQAIHYFSKSF